MKSHLRVLLVEDNAGDADLIQEYLSQSRQVVFEIECVPRLASAISFLEREQVDVIVLDLGLPDSSGLETLSRVLESAPKKTIVVLTGLDDHLAGMAAVKLGAQDYLLKGDIAPDVLIRTILYSLERKTMQEALRRSESLLKEAQRVAHMGHWEIKSPVGTPEWSQEIFHIFGLDPDRGEPSFPAHQDLIHPDDWDLLNNSVTRGSSEGIPFDIDFRLIRADKSIRWMNAKGYPTAKREGKFFNMFGTAQDVTERKLAREALRESEEQYRAVFDNAGIGIDLLDQEGKVVKANQALLTMLGYTAEELSQITFLNIAHPDDREISERNLKTLMAGEIDSYRLEKRYVRKDGSIMWADLWSSSVRDAKGKSVGTVAVIEDITQRKRAEEESRASELRYRRLFEAAKDGILILDAETGQIVDVNPFLVHLLRYSREEMLEKKLWEIGLWRDIAQCKVVFAELQSNEYVRYEDLPLETEAGKIVNVEFVSNVYLVNGAKVIQCNIRDITERRRAGEALASEKKRFEALAESSPFGISMIRQDGSFEYANPKFREMFGYDLSEIPTGRDWLRNAFPDPDYRHEVIAAWLEDLEKTSPDQLRPRIFTVTCKDGTRKVIHFRPVLLPSGEHVVTYEDITQSKRAEEVLKAASVYNRSLIEASLDPLVTISAEGKITDVNAATERVTGYSREELIRTDFSDYFTDPQKARNGYRRAFTDGVVKDYELEIRHRDGDLTPVIYNASVYHDRSGEIVGVFAAARDITERKISEELIHIRLNLLEFAASHPLDELLQKTLDEIGALTNSPIGFYHFVESDQKTLSLQAWSTRTVKEFCKAAGKGQHYSIDRAGVWVDCIRERKPVIHNDYSSLPHRKGMPEGHAAVIRELVVPIIKSGQIVAVLGIGNKPTDYTEKDIEVVSYFADVAWEINTRKRAQEALKESEQQYRTLFEESIDGVYSVLRDGTITDANTAFCELFGYTIEEMIGKDIRELYFDPADRPRFQKEIEKQGFVKDYEVKFQKRDGTEVDCLLSSSVHFGKDGSITGYRGIVRDLTARKALQRQLVQAQKMEAVGTLAGGIAHDFNNILQVVLGYSELVLGDEDLPDRLRNDLGRVLLAGKSGADLVQRLLTFSRKTETKPLNLDLNQRIRQTQKFLERTIPKMINIEMVLAEDLARIYADPTQMDQVLMNLAVNARDAMPEGRRLVIETANVFLDEESDKALLGAKPGEYVLLSVSDTGHGMDKETLDHIFEPFYTTKEAGKGTGLGLSVVYGIVQQHGGYITCYSEPGQGTTFKMYFPTIEMEMNPDVATSGIMPAFGTETILLVDDEEFVRDLGKRILERSGYTVLTAANGKEALELYRRQKETISLVILDLIMPEMGGKQCLEELLKIEPKARVLIASGYSADGPTKEALQGGATGFVSKPFDVRQLLQTVRKVLDEA